MRKNLTIAATAVLALTLTACGGGNDSSSSSSTTDHDDPATTQAPEPTAEVDDPEPVTQAPAPAPDPIVSLSDYDDAMLLLDLTWDQQDFEARDSMCWGYDVLGPQWIVDELNSSSPEPINERAIRDHFAEVC